MAVLTACLNSYLGKSLATAGLHPTISRPAVSQAMALKSGGGPGLTLVIRGRPVVARVLICLLAETN